MEGSEHKNPVGIIGSGSFGMAIANLLAENVDVLLYARREEVRLAIEKREGRYSVLSPRIQAVSDLQLVAQKCQLIFPIVPSQAFRSMMKQLSPYLNPTHFLIHGTKGLDLQDLPQGQSLHPEHIKTMSQVIEEESIVCRIGCLSGPNLSKEIMEGQPAATLIASPFTEVIKAGQAVLKSNRFQVYGDHDIIGAELAGALKNIIALAAGILGGKGLGKNLWALLVTRGLSEMIHIGKAVGADVKPFLGVAGIGDLVATASSENSRNYKAGYRLGKGETLDDIMETSTDVIEGVKTLETIRALGAHLGITTPIVEIVYRVFFKKMPVDNAIQFLITYPYAVDVDFLP
ncbi:NAD(P)H-dependent glycerol-3-phosphate dehydrogenase [Aureispira anguillae]|uniref:Glycerol-3-phosphate dehydrogenase [NAD(P)+] n=1 Tax=Aureispira anguillae TaxID=2864201 RepID=A0A915YLE3_9BACT|nr:NAD(P)H-dependent glycerol-3-phosphate dehydrogenase [Aureispira anguillae]BDS15377.1 NAD(P)H-dependent glycerol-3-phosphate dehydrogenase [Aureispira anguillae]